MNTHEDLDWNNATFLQQQEAAAQHILRVVCPEYALEDFTLAKAASDPRAYQLTRLDLDQKPLPLLPYWNAIELLPDAVLVALLVNIWNEVPVDTSITKLAAAGIALRGMAVTTEVYDRLLGIVIEARADGYERAEWDTYKHLYLPDNVRLEVAQEKAVREFNEEFIHTDEVWMYQLGWMRGYQDALDQDAEQD